MAQYNVNEGQSLLDIALELYGTPEMVVKLAADNDLNINDDVTGTLLLAYDETLFALVDTSTYYRLNNLHVVTAESNSDGMLEHSPEEHTREEHN